MPPKNFSTVLDSQVSLYTPVQSLIKVKSLNYVYMYITESPAPRKVAPFYLYGFMSVFDILLTSVINVKYFYLCRQNFPSADL